MTIGDVLVDPAVLSQPWAEPKMAISAVRLESFGAPSGLLALPPWPVIGIGNTEHPMAACLDLVVRDDAAARSVIINCQSYPRAAGILVQLLRLNEALPVEQALVAESLAYGVLQGSREHADWLAALNDQPSLKQGRLLLERHGSRLDLLLDRPQSLNAINRHLRDALCEAFELAVLDPDIETVEWRAVGRAFSMGADLSEFGTTRDPVTAHSIRMRTLPAHLIARCASKLRVHIQGGCVGAGIEMAAFASHIVATPEAWFQLPELSMGLIPGAGGCVSLARRIGRQRTAWMVLSGKRVNARQALDWGLIDELAKEA